MVKEKSEATPRGSTVVPGTCRWNQGILEQYISIDETRHDWIRVPSTTEAKPPATLDAITPNEAVVGSDDLEVVLTGTNFVEGATIVFDGVAKSTEFVSETELKATVSPLFVLEPKSVNVTIKINTTETWPPLMFTFKAEPGEAPPANPLSFAKSAPKKAEAEDHRASNKTGWSQGGKENEKEREKETVK